MESDINRPAASNGSPATLQRFTPQVRGEGRRNRVHDAMGAPQGGSGAWLLPALLVRRLGVSVCRDDPF